MPEKFAPELTLNAKRKRGGENDDEDDENEDSEDDQEESDGEGEDLVIGSAAPRRKSRPKKPAAKKPKTNGASSGLPASLPSRPKKTMRGAIVDEAERDGLYGTIAHDCIFRAVVLTMRS